MLEESEERLLPEDPREREELREDPEDLREELREDPDDLRLELEELREEPDDLREALEDEERRLDDRDSGFDQDLELRSLFEDERFREDDGSTVFFGAEARREEELERPRDSWVRSDRDGLEAVGRDEDRLVRVRSRLDDLRLQPDGAG